MIDFPYLWSWNASPMRPMDRKGQRCRVLARGGRNSALIEFEDGFKVIASRNALRKFVAGQDATPGRREKTLDANRR